MTQKDLESRSGVTQQMLSKLERGKSDSTGDLVALASALEVTAEWLLTGRAPSPSVSAAPLGPLMIAAPPPPEPGPPALTPRQQALLGYFNGLTAAQQDAVLRELQETERLNKDILEQLSPRKHSSG